jgi:hypothetical protein
MFNDKTQKEYANTTKLSEYSEVFRQKLLCCLSKIDGDDTQDQQEILKQNQPLALTPKTSDNKFKILSKRLSKILNKIVSSKIFKNCFAALLAIDSLVIGICVNNYEKEAENSSGELRLLASFQIFVTIIFFFEIVAKLLIDVKTFWKSPWNIFEFFICQLTSFCQIMDAILVFNHNSLIKQNRIISFIKFIRVFRILRNLRLLSHFVELRIIIICLTRAIRSVVLISILLLIISFLFAKIGFILFSSMNQMNDPILGDCFSSIMESLITLFAVMTLDQWWKIFSIASDYYNTYFLATFYFVAWIILASFIFQNLFTGIMVNNFQEIRKDVIKALSLKKMQKKIQHDMKLRSKLSNHSLKHAKSTKSELNLNETEFKNKLINNLKFFYRDTKNNRVHRIEKTNIEKLNEVIQKMKEYRSDNQQWVKLMKETMYLLNNITTNELWQEENLIKYYESVENLMENLKERMLLLDLANQSLLKMHDKNNNIFPLEFYNKK